jgi:spermidine/putrescine transport system permease protein
MKRLLTGKLPELMISLPSIAWLVALFVIPTMIIIVIAFRTGDPYGGIGAQWTLEHFRELLNPIYRDIMVRTVTLSLLTTVLCLVLGIPAGYWLARTEKKWRDLMLLLVIVPFWINFLIRIFAWKVVLHPDGAVKNVLLLLGLVDADSLLLYRPATVLLVMVYTYIPFAILPIYAAAERFDYSLLDAAHDLGAGWFSAFARVFLPGGRESSPRSWWCSSPPWAPTSFPTSWADLAAKCWATKLPRKPLSTATFPRRACCRRCLFSQS